MWKQVEHDLYPEQRMKHLLTVTTTVLIQTTQKQLSNIDVWQDLKNREQIRLGVNLCERWSFIAEQLTGTYWRHYNPHLWKSEPFKSLSLSQFKRRLNDILSIRSSYDQNVRFSKNQENLSAKKAFSPFAHIDAMQFDSSTESQWLSAKNQFENLMASQDREVAQQLRDHFRTLHSNPQQMLLDFKRYADLVQREAIRRELASERELLLGQLESDIRTLTDEFNNLNHGKIGIGKKSITRGVNRTVIAASLDANRQIETQVFRF